MRVVVDLPHLNKSSFPVNRTNVQSVPQAVPQVYLGSGVSTLEASQGAHQALVPLGERAEQGMVLALPPRSGLEEIPFMSAGQGTPPNTPGQEGLQGSWEP